MEYCWLIMAFVSIVLCLRRAEGHCYWFVFVSVATFRHQHIGMHLCNGTFVINGSWSDSRLFQRDYFVKKTNCFDISMENTSIFTLTNTLGKPSVVWPSFHFGLSMFWYERLCSIYNCTYQIRPTIHTSSIHVPRQHANMQIECIELQGTKLVLNWY